MAIADIDKLDALLVVGSNLRREVPILAHRVRKAARRGARVAFVNPARFPYQFPVAAYCESSPAQHVTDLAAVLAACAETAGRSVPEHLSGIVGSVQVRDMHRAADLRWRRHARQVRRERLAVAAPCRTVVSGSGASAPHHDAGA